MTVSIDGTGDICTLINTFDVSPENAEALADSLRRFTETFARHRTGFVGDAVHVSRGRSRVVNYLQWELDSDLQAALGAGEARNHLTEVERPAERITPVFYEVVYVACQLGCLRMGGPDVRRAAPRYARRRRRLAISIRR